jgi:hypothetical protein
MIPCFSHPDEVFGRDTRAFGAEVAHQGHRIQCVGDDPIDPHQPQRSQFESRARLGPWRLAMFS